MRIIYRTPRLENAERIGALLEAEGVKVRLLYGPHFRRSTWKGANYRQGSDPGNWPRVMVLSNGDLPKARSVLRAAGIMPPPAYAREDDARDDSLVFRRSLSAHGDPAGMARYIRIGLIVVVLVLATLQAARYLA